MKLRLLNVLGSALLLGAVTATAAESVPYYTDLDSNDPSWTIGKVGSGQGWSNDNESGYTYFDPVGSSKGLKKQYDKDNAADAWFISPAISVSAGQTYTVSVYTRTDPRANSGERESFKITAGDEATPAAQKAGTVVLDLKSYENKGAFEQQTGTYTATADGEVYFGLNCYSAADQYTMFVTAFSVTADGASEGGDEPGEGEGGDQPGEGEDQPGEEVETVSLPYESELFPGGFLDEGWTNFNGNEGVTGSWEVDTDSDGYTINFFEEIGATSGAQVCTYESSEDNTDAWLFSPAIAVEEGKEYLVSIYARIEDDSTSEVENFKVTVGSEANKESQTETLIDQYEYDNTGSFEQFTAVYTASETGVVHFGINCYSGPDNYYLYVTKFSVKENGAEGGDPVEGVVLYTEFFDENTVNNHSTPVEGWTNQSTVNGGKPWYADNESGPQVLSKAGATYGAYYAYDYKNNADAWLISPAVNFVGGQEYTLTIWAYTKRDPENFKITYATGNSVTDQKAGTVILDKTGYTNNTSEFEQLTATFTPATSGTYHIGVNCYSTTDGWNLYVTGLKITGAIGGGEGPVDPTPGAKVPAAVEDFYVAADAFDDLKVTLSWDYPKNATNGEALADGDMVRAELYRNGELIYTDSALEYSFGVYEDEPATAGVYTYKVRVYGVGDVYDEAGEIEVSAGYVGKPMMEMPVYYYTFRESVAEKFTVLDQNGDGSTWSYDGGEYYGSFENRLPQGTTIVNDYICTPYVHLEPGLYEVIYDLTATYQTYEVGYTTMRNVMNENFTVMTGFNENLGYYSGYVTIVEEGDYAFGVHHTGATEYDEDSNYLKFEGLEINKIEIVPNVATNLEGKGTLESVVLTWTNPANDNTGAALTEITKAIVYRDNVVVATIENVDGTILVPGQESSYTDSSFEWGGEFTYKVEIYNENGKSESAAPTVKVFGGKGLKADLQNKNDFKTWKFFRADGTTSQWSLPYYSDDINFWSMSYGVTNHQDYAATPFIYLEDGRGYKFEIEVYAGTSGNGNGTLEFVVGSDHKHEAMSTVGSMFIDYEDPQVNTFYFVTSETATVAEGEGEDIEINYIPAGNTTFGVRANNSQEDLYVKSYSITADDSLAGVKTILAASGALSYQAGTVYTTKTASEIAVYALDGTKLAAVYNADSLSLENLAHGTTVVVVAVVDGQRCSLKIFR